MCRIADVGDVPVQRRYHLDEGLHDIEKYYQMVKDAGITPLTVGGDHSITYPILKVDMRRTPPFGRVYGLPTTFVISPQGKLVETRTGSVDMHWLESVIKPADKVSQLKK